MIFTQLWSTADSFAVPLGLLFWWSFDPLQSLLLADWTVKIRGRNGPSHHLPPAISHRCGILWRQDEDLSAVGGDGVLHVGLVGHPPLGQNFARLAIAENDCSLPQPLGHRSLHFGLDPRIFVMAAEQGQDGPSQRNHCQRRQSQRSQN